MFTGNEILLYLSIKYQGCWDDIFAAIKNKEAITHQDIINAKNSISCNYITLLDEKYPKQLKNIFKPPFVLFYYGDINLISNMNYNLAIVGSRDCKENNAILTAKIILELKNKYVIVSGLAKGIDSIAHKSSIDNNGKTVAVLGCGIDYVYPKNNRQIYENLKKDHLLISEYPNDLSPKPEYFPFRNRIIAGLCWGVLIPEVKVNSGTITTIGHALNQGKEVFVFPQEIGNGTYNNHLISEGAILVESAEDINDEKNNIL